MDEQYDVIVLGTGLTECVLSGLMSVSKKKVLHMDRNDYYGGESASLTPLDQVYNHFKMGVAPPEHFGRGRDWNVDLIPKYLEFKSIEGSYVFKGNKIHKIPANEKEGLGTIWIPKKTPVRRCSLNLGLTRTPRILTAMELLCIGVRNTRMHRCWSSLIGESCIMNHWRDSGNLRIFTHCTALENCHRDLQDGKVVGVESEGEVAKCKQVICDPSYAPDKVKKTGQVVRAICILNHPVKDTKDVASVQIIIPQNQVNRKHDIYVSVVSATHQIAAKGFYLAIVSTTVETGNPEQELQIGLDLLGAIEQKFVTVSDMFEQIPGTEESNVFISKSYDATSHFETTCDDVLDLYEKIMGEKFDFSQVNLHQQEEM
ncbi:GDIB-like protein [Mya arenaria]|uniref:GDIB-like protein n=1 Tax=Mya arenaria TaxID=6604 RepID=A0ABY7G037_MYAAR|nr:GDIB-like protein [Mya arenaria]